MYDRSLTKALEKYRENGTKRKELVDAIALRVYHMAQLKDDWDEDDVGDFILHFLPKIPGLIDQYKDKGSSFEVYLYVHTVWNIKSFAKHLKTCHYQTTLNTFETFWEVHEHTPEDDIQFDRYIPENIRKLYKISADGSLTNTVWKQRFLFLILRETEYIDNSLLENISSAMDINKKWILNCITALKERMSKRLNRLNFLRQKRNYWFYRYYILQLRLSDTYESEKRAKVLEQIDRAREKFSIAREKVRNFNTRPTNRDISEVLNIPKGSIDSGIYYIVNRYRQHVELFEGEQQPEQKNTKHVDTHFPEAETIPETIHKKEDDAAA